jgi:hypothetical protein
LAARSLITAGFLRDVDPAEWTDKLGKTMNEVEFEGEIFKMNLIYHKWTIEKLNDNTNLISQILFPLK